MPTDNKNSAVIIWLTLLAVVIFAMIIVGGITRLTKSGLSIVEWQPIMGVIPPLNEQDWNEVFEKYKQFPEYEILNRNISMDGFKSIYLWEYWHRLIARSVAFLFLIPWTYLVIKKRLSKKLNLKLLGLFLLGGGQGVLGWYMVKSGLVDLPRVSHYRLAAHLALAMTLLGATFWQIQNLRFGLSKCAGNPNTGLKKLAFVFVVIVSIQIYLGAVVAGLDAGLVFNTFPKLAGNWIPPGMFILNPWWSNLFNNHITIHFFHRTIGWLILFSIGGIWLYSKKLNLSSRQRIAINFTSAVVAVQFLLGVLTIILRVPVVVAVLHQAFAAILLISALNVIHAIRHKPKLN